MPRTSTVKMDENGSIQLPRSVRRQFRAGSRFAVLANNGTITLKEVPSEPKPPLPKTRKEAMKRILRISEKIARDFDRRGITKADLRRTIKRLRAQKRAQGHS